jgi:hypothetical protein
MAANDNLMNFFDEIDRAPGEFCKNNQSQESVNFDIIEETDELCDQNFNMQTSNEYLAKNRNFASPKMNNFVGNEHGKCFNFLKVNTIP